MYVIPHINNRILDFFWELPVYFNNLNTFRSKNNHHNFLGFWNFFFKTSETYFKDFILKFPSNFLKNCKNSSENLRKFSETSLKNKINIGVSNFTSDPRLVVSKVSNLFEQLFGYLILKLP